MPVTRSPKGASAPESSTGITLEEFMAMENTGTSEQEKSVLEKDSTKTSLATDPPCHRSLASVARDDRTLRPRSKASSRRSVRKNIAVLEARLQLAQLQLEQARAAVEVEKLQLEIMQAESSENEEESEEERDLTTRRVDMWPAMYEPRPFARVAAPPAVEDTRPPDASGVPASEDVNVREAPHYVERVRRRDGERKISPARTSIEVAALTAAFIEAARNTARAAMRYEYELPPFSGLSSEWLSFRATFEETQDGFTALENVIRLRRSLKGAALEAVTALLITHTGPEEIMRALERRFGRPDALVLAEMEKVKALPKVGDNPRDLCIFANRIANIVATVEVLKKPQYLHSPEMLRSAIEKLSPILKNKWYDFAAANEEDQPELKKLATFLNREADKCAAYAPIELEGDMDMRKMENTLDMETKTKQQDSRCPQCKGEHRLLNCQQFLRADVNSRWEMTKKHRICFRCLKSDHRRATCHAPVCGQRGCMMHHHRFLHHVKRQEETERSPPTTAEARQETVFCSHLRVCEKKNEKLENTTKNYSEPESLNIKERKKGSDSENLALEIPENETRHLPNDRYDTGLSWKKVRSKNMEKKLDRDEELKKQYQESLGNRIASSYAEVAIASPTGGRTRYQPHFAVVNPDKKKEFEHLRRRRKRRKRPLLQHRREPYSIGSSPNVGHKVAIRDPFPRKVWPRGRVISAYPGKDGKIGAVDMTTTNGYVLRRPTKKIVVLPGESQDATAGECSRR